MKPVRIQRKRTKGWRMPPNTVSVTRPGRWGNPYRVSPSLNAHDAVEHFRLWIGRNSTFPNALDAGPTVNAIRRELRGKNLSCFCPLDQPCHADVLLEIANSGEV